MTEQNKSVMTAVVHTLVAIFCNEIYGVLVHLLHDREIKIVKTPSFNE